MLLRHLVFDIERLRFAALPKWRMITHREALFTQLWGKYLPKP